MDENKTKDEIFAKALIHIIENQIRLKKHLGIVSDNSYYGDCYCDYQMIDELEEIE